MQLPAEKSRVIRFGLFEVDLREAELRRGGVRLKLQEQPFQILTTLLERPGQTVTREELRQKLWPADTFVDFDHSLNSSINKLREALCDKADTPRYIETIPKRGYRFIGEIIRNEAKEQSVSAAPMADQSLEKIAITLPSAAMAASRKSRVLRRWRIWTLGVVALIAVAVAIYAATAPSPMPRIVGSHVLTKSGYQKVLSPFVDRGSLYFNELRPAGFFTVQVSTAGGELRSLKVCCMTDISRDGSEALWDLYNPKTKGCDTWVQSLPAGTLRMVVHDACWPIWSADGRSFFFMGNSYTELYHANSDGTGVVRLASVRQPQFFLDPHLSPDGSRIRFTGGAPTFTLWEIGTDGSNPHSILSGYSHVQGGSWSSDGTYYFFSSWSGDRSNLWVISEARRWRKAKTVRPQQLTFGPMSIRAPAISRDGKQLYAIGNEEHGELSAYDSNTSKFVPYLGGESISMVDFSRDGQWIAYVTYPEGTLWRSRIDGSERRQLTVPPMVVQNPCWSPDGKLIAFTDLSNGEGGPIRDDGPHRIYAVSGDGGSPMLLLAGYFGDPTWSPDGKSMAYHYLRDSGISEVRILDLQSQKSTTVSGSQGIWSPRWSPDGKHLAALAGACLSLSGACRMKLVLFDFARNAWDEIAISPLFGWPSWSRDSKFVYAREVDSLVVRFAIANRKKERVSVDTGLKRINGWFGLTPDGRPIITRDTGIEEMYAFDLEYK